MVEGRYVIIQYVNFFLINVFSPSFPPFNNIIALFYYYYYFHLMFKYEHVLNIHTKFCAIYLEKIYILEMPAYIVVIKEKLKAIQQ